MSWNRIKNTAVRWGYLAYCGLCRGWTEHDGFTSTKCAAGGRW